MSRALATIPCVSPIHHLDDVQRDRACCPAIPVIEARTEQIDTYVRPEYMDTAPELFLLFIPIRHHLDSDVFGWENGGEC